MYMNRLSDLLFVLARVGEPSGGGRGDRVVGGAERPARVRLLPAPRARALRELPRRVSRCCRRTCGRTSPRCTPSRASPTTSPTRAAARRTSGSPTWPHGASACGRALTQRPDPGGADARRRVRGARRHHPTPASCEPQLLDDLLSAFAQDVTTTPLRHVGRRARLLPAFGEPGRPARPADRRADATPVSTSRVRCRLLGAATRELLAGPRGRLGPRPPVRAGRGWRRARRDGGLARPRRR